MYQTGQTIVETLDQIHRHELVLPAIQREFVWKPQQVCRLFDSIMQGFPFGTFLYWKVARENSAKFNYYDFVLNYHELKGRHCPPHPRFHDTPLIAVLDGQQRLTALNIGLRGSMATKLPRLWWNNPYAFPKRYLFLDLLCSAGTDDNGDSGYRFRFRRESDPKLVRDSEGNLTECWFQVSQVLAMDGGPPMVKWLNQRLDQKSVYPAYETLDRLHSVVKRDHVIAYYEEKRQKLDEVLQIFIRMNDGGTPLSYSDMLLSIAVAQWTKHDAREEIHRCVDELNRIGSGEGFAFSNDFVLKAGLMLSDIGSVRFKVDNFNRENMAKLEKQWPSIKQTLALAVQLVAGFGFSRVTLTSNNAVLPIAYYLHQRGLSESFLSHSRYEAERQAIRGWLIRSLLKKGVWRGIDSLLTALRRVLREHGENSFPASKLYAEMARTGRELVFNEEEIEDLADSEFKSRTFALLSLIFPHVDPRMNCHVDHIFPAAMFTPSRLRSMRVPVDQIEQFRDRANRLGNLQLLPGPMNTEKSATMPHVWLATAYPDENSRRQFVNDNLLGQIPTEITGFLDFYEARRARLVARIKNLLGSVDGTD